ncbi:hypothetical protein ACC676_39265, partial [Rhizobium ruizarguesonis]
NNVTHIVIGAPKKPTWRDLWSRSITDELIRRAGEISVHVISGNEKDGTTTRGVKAAVTPPPLDCRAYLLATGYVANAERES